MMEQENDKLIAELETEWRKLCRTAQGEKFEPQIFDVLIKNYSEPHRVYHDLSHIKALLDLSAEFAGEIEDSTAVNFAIWFHDAIYNPQASDNEERSAEFAVQSLQKLEIAEHLSEIVRQMILATKTHNAESLGSDGKLFLDFDLSILGAEAAVYQQYTAAIRREYAFVPEVLYRGGRRNILENFLRRTVIYFTGECRERFEARARENIAAEIADLSS